MTLTLNLGVTLPVLAPLIAAVLVLLVDAAAPKQRLAHLLLTGVGLAAGAVATVPGLAQVRGDRRGAFCLPSGHCLYDASRLTSALQLAALLAALVVLVLAWRDWSHEDSQGRTPVVAALFLGATGGVVAVPAAGDLGTLLVALELATLPTVALVALVRTDWGSDRRAHAIDGSVSLLTTSLVSFGLLAMGAALWVAATGSAVLAVPDEPRVPLLVLASVFLLAGLGFKVSAVPFHAWTPITYAAAPLPVTVYLSTVSKVAALGGLVVMTRALGRIDDTTLVAVAVMAAASMTLGNLIALNQNDTVRLLAWSTVAQAGWVLLPLASLSSRAVHAAAAYLVVYVVATLLAFVVVIAVARAAVSAGQADGSPATTALRTHRGLLRTHPLLAIPLGFALLTLAGMPPGIAGLVAKVVALRPVVGDGTWWLAAVAAVNVALGIAVYLRWLTALVAPVEADSLPRPVRVDRARAQRSAQEEGDETAGADATSGPDETAGADDRAGADLQAPGPRHPSIALWVLVVVLTALLIVGSISPVGTL